ncbi:MAG: sugar phosphate isomerase/epimerase family protein [Anaerolineae bacterium]
MKRGIFEGAFPPGLEPGRCAQQAQAAGFQGLELSMRSLDPLLSEARNELTEGILSIERGIGLAAPRPGGLYLSSSDAEVNALRRRIANAGLEVTSVSTMLLFHYPLSSPIPAVRRQAVLILRRMLEAAALLGADAILVPPAMVTPDVSYREAWQRSQEALADMVPSAAELGVAMAIENVWNRFLLSPLEFCDYIDRLASPYVGAYFDVANVLRYGFPDQWIEALGSRLKRVHFKDYRLDVDDLRGFTHLLNGDVPWPRVMQALRRVGYDGWVVAEVTPYRYCPEQAVADSAAALQAIFALG